MGNLKPAHGNCSTVEYQLSTSSTATAPGQPLAYIGTPGDAGYLGVGAPTSAVGIIAVCAETKTGSTTRSALASTGDNSKVLAWPATPDKQFLAVCSSTPTVAMLDVAWGVAATGLIANETTTESAFVIERIVDATAKTVIGRFVSGHYIPRIGFTHAVGS